MLFALSDRELVVKLAWPAVALIGMVFGLLIFWRPIQALNRRIERQADANARIIVNFGQRVGLELPAFEVPEDHVSVWLSETIAVVEPGPGGETMVRLDEPAPVVRGVIGEPLLPADVEGSWESLDP